MFCDRLQHADLKAPSGLPRHAVASVPAQLASVRRGSQLAALSLDVEAMPGTLGWPLVGETLPFVQSPAAFHRERKAKHGSIYKTSFLGRNTVAIDDADEVSFLLKRDKRLLEVDWPKGVHDMLGPLSLATRTGPSHEGARAVVMQAFTKQAVDGYVPSIAKLFQQRLASWPEQDSLRVFVAVKDLVFELAAAVLLGFDLPAETLEQCRAYNSQAAAAMFQIPLKLNPIYSKGLEGRKGLLTITQKLIESMPAEEPGSAKQSTTALQLLKAARDEEGNGLSMAELLDLTMNIYFAATETTAFTLTSMITQLIRHPTVLQRLKQEQQQVLAKHGSEISSEALGEMPYTTAVVRESLRFKPAVAGLFRQAKEDIEVGGYLIPKGYHLLLHMPFARLESESFPSRSPTAFEPERWLDEQQQLIKEPRFFIPFGEGPRHCVGWRLAMEESKTMAALLARHCTWEQLNPGQQLEEAVAQGNDDAVKMRFTYSEAPII